MNNSMKKPMTVSEKIIDDWGTITHFCRKNDININTFKSVFYGKEKSSVVVAKLKKHGYIKNASELQKKIA